MMDWKTVTGWLSPPEGMALRKLACGKEVLELGSFCGRSTVAMAPMALRLVSLDWHQGDRGTGPAQTLGTFRENLKRFGVEDIVDVLVGDIGEVGATLPDASFDLVFIDSAHDVQSVERDARLALRVVRPGGVIAWHDSQYQTVVEGLKAAGIDGTKPDYLVDTLSWITVPHEEKESA